jgi:hypothetical protein
MSAPWVEAFVSKMAESVGPLEPELQNRLVAVVPVLVATRYGDPVWNAGKKTPD